MKKLVFLALILGLFAAVAPSVMAAEPKPQETLAELIESLSEREAEEVVTAGQLRRHLARAEKILGEDLRPKTLSNKPMTYTELCQELCSFLEHAEYRLHCLHKPVILPDECTEAERTIADAAVIRGYDYYMRDDIVTYGELVPILERLFILMEAKEHEGMVFSAPPTTVEETEPVDVSYFADACMIGHSQTNAYPRFSDIPMRFYAQDGFTAFQGFVCAHFQPAGGVGTLTQALTDNQYSKIYLMYGVNDCNSALSDPNEFIDAMKLHFDLIEETQNDPDIFLFSVFPIREFLRVKNPYHTTAIDNVNRMIYGLARYYDVEFLNMYELIGDENGYMREEIETKDGLHFGQNAYDMLTEYLLCHTLQEKESPGTLFPGLYIVIAEAKSPSGSPAEGHSGLCRLLEPTTATRMMSSTNILDIPYI